LGRGFLCFGDGHITPGGIGDNIPSLAMDAPQLSHLWVETDRLEEFFHEFLVFNRWLDIENTPNSIQKITIITNEGTYRRQWNLKEICEELLIKDINDYITGETNISFEIASVDVEGVKLDRDVWKTWRLNVHT
jgi:hypothetical protein